MSRVADDAQESHEAYQDVVVLRQPHKMSNLALTVGQTVQLNDGRKAVIRFHGTTAFAPGEWVGIELEAATGKNDGSVKGDRYFHCEANHGMFLRAAGISRILEEPETQGGNGDKAAARDRVVSMGSRQSTLGLVAGGAAGVTGHRREASEESPTPSRSSAVSRLGGIKVGVE